MSDVLTIAALAPVVSFLIAWCCWFFYVACMAFLSAYRAGTLTGVTFWLALPFGAAGYLLDIITNLTFGTLFFAQFPRWLLLTARCDWNMTFADIQYPPGHPLHWLGVWRARLAIIICQHFLDPFQVSGHCHRVGDGNRGGTPSLSTVR